MDQVFPKKINSTNQSAVIARSESDEAIQPIFKGTISKILNNPKYQEFAKKHKDSNFPMHLISATDALTTGTFIYQTQKSKKIKEERKDTLCYNAAISTGLSILSSYFIDKITNKPTEKFIAKFKEANKNDKKLDKYVEGIQIAKPILILGGVYYILIPFISTFLADRIGHSLAPRERARVRGQQQEPTLQ